jgi:hypothetical protein
MFRNSCANVLSSMTRTLTIAAVLLSAATAAAQSKPNGAAPAAKPAANASGVAVPADFRRT